MEDVFIEVPDLDGIALRPGTPFSLTRLDSAHPSLVLGARGRLVYRGTYCAAIGTILALQRTSQASMCAGGELLRLLSTTTKRLVFARVAGSHEELQELTDQLLPRKGRPPKGAAARGGGGGSGAAAAAAAPKPRGKPGPKPRPKPAAAEEEEEEEEAEEAEEEDEDEDLEEAEEEEEEVTAAAVDAGVRGQVDRAAQRAAQDGDSSSSPEEEEEVAAAKSGEIDEADFVRKGKGKRRRQ